MKKLVKNYDPKTAPAINVPRRGHTIGRSSVGVVSRNIKGIKNARRLLARDLRELRRVYPDIPSSALRELIKNEQGIISRNEVRQMKKKELLIRSLYDSIVKENKKMYSEMFYNNVTSKNSTTHWKQALSLFNDLSGDNKVVLLNIIEETMIDTISNLLGIIDGNVTLSGNVEPPQLFYDGKDVSDEMQDLFLEFIEDMEAD